MTPNYQVFLTDDINIAELDVEQVDFQTQFAVSDIRDIVARKDNVKTITFKTTKNNNNVFGYLFDLGRKTDVNNPTNLFYNYNPIKPVTALIYEDSMLIFKGSLRVQQIQMVGNSGTYTAVITGSFIDLKTTIQDLYLTDLVFSDLKHQYNIQTITNSWSGNTQRYDSIADDFYFTASTLSGYVYPNIDYGYFANNDSLTINNIDVRNFKPAIFLNEYLTRIFTQTGLTGFTYEIKGSPQFQDMFNHIVIPDTQEGNTATYTGFTTTYSKPTGTTVNSNTIFGDAQNEYVLVDISNIVQPPPETIGDIMDVYGGYKNVLQINRNFTSSGQIDITFASIVNNQTGTTFSGFHEITTGISVTISIQLVKRTAAGNQYADDGGWGVVSQYSFVVPYKQSLYNQTYSVGIGSTDFDTTEQLGVRIVVASPNGYGIVNTGFFERGPIDCKYIVSACTLSMPANILQQIKVDVLPSLLNGDIIIPQAPNGIKQYDFLKSIINQFNFFVYTRNDNYKHLIFEKYDDYYTFALPQNLKFNALDWSNKLDTKNAIVYNTNLDLPKAYTFTYKDDVDFLTDLYKTNYNQNYGSLNFIDSYGLIDAQDVELIFSPTIPLNESGTDRIYPALYKYDNGAKEVSATNIRLCSYNGVFPCTDYTIVYMTGSTTQIFYSGNTYPQLSNYFVSGGTVINDIHFAAPYQYYFTANADYQTAPNSYNSFYINQVTELTNPDVQFITANFLLNEIDIGNLDERVPIYLNTGDFNGAYFKVIKVTYQGSDKLSPVQLQKIPL